MHENLSCFLYMKPLKRARPQSVDGLKLKSESDKVANTMQGFSAISLKHSTADEEIRLLNAKLQNINIKIKTLLVKTYTCYSEQTGITQ